MNLYAVLGIPRDADDDAIRNAYRLLARQYHPDRGAGSSAEKFRQVNDAYETLINPERRASYNYSLPFLEPVETLHTAPIRPEARPFPQEDPRIFGKFLSVRTYMPITYMPIRTQRRFVQFFLFW